MKWKGWIGGVLLVMMLFGTLGCLPGGKRGQLLHRLRPDEAAGLRCMRLAARTGRRGAGVLPGLRQPSRVRRADICTLDRRKQ